MNNGNIARHCNDSQQQQHNNDHKTTVGSRHLVIIIVLIVFLIIFILLHHRLFLLRSTGGHFQRNRLNLLRLQALTYIGFGKTAALGGSICSIFLNLNCIAGRCLAIFRPGATADGALSRSFRIGNSADIANDFLHLVTSIPAQFSAPTLSPLYHLFRKKQLPNRIIYKKFFD